MFARLSVAGVLLLAAGTALAARPRASIRQLALAAVAGVLLLGLGQGGMVWGVRSLPSGKTAVFASSAPIFVALFSWLVLGARLRWQTWIGIAIGFTLAHELLDGNGYHRRLPAVACTAASRVLAAADAYHAMCEARPHRIAFDADRAATELKAMAKRSELCPDAVTAVLATAGHEVRSAPRPSGLADREMQVLLLLVQGLTNKEIASALGISTKTAGQHVQHVLEKLGVTTRAAATMIAMKTGIA